MQEREVVSPFPTSKETADDDETMLAPLFISNDRLTYTTRKAVSSICRLSLSTFYLGKLRAEGVELFSHLSSCPAGGCENGDGVFIRPSCLSHLSLLL